MKYHFLHFKKTRKNMCFFLFVTLLVNVACSDNFDPLVNNTNDALDNSKLIEKYYYYVDGEKYFLQLNTEYVFVSSVEEYVIENLKLSPAYTIREKEKDGASSAITRSPYTGYYWAEVKMNSSISEMDYMKEIEKIQNDYQGIMAAPYFKSESGNKVGISNYFYVGLRELRDTIRLKELAEHTQTKIIGSESFLPLWYTMSVTPQTGKNALDIANYFYETGLFEHCQPSFRGIVSYDIVYNDPWLPQQWEIMNYNLFDAWDISEGEGIKIAIVDTGVDRTHPDLARNMHSYSYDAESGISPSVIHEPHGTMCAGVAAAVGNNGIGMTGVAPKSKIIDISFNPDGEFVERKLATAITKSWSEGGADIISNSWHLNMPSSVVESAINQATRQGRGGKGCVVLCSTGNDNYVVQFPARLPNTLSVGSIDESELRSWFSNYGEYLDVVAPGDNITCTFPGGYYAAASGTSFSCPYVAGVAALILSLSPYLLSSDMEKIIKTTCSKLYSYNFSNHSGYDYGTWNNEVGYGLVNPLSALRKTQEENNREYRIEFRIYNYKSTGFNFDYFFLDPTITPIPFSGNEVYISSGDSYVFEELFKRGTYALVYYVNVGGGPVRAVRSTFEVPGIGIHKIELR